AGRRGRLEDVARAVEVDLAALAAAGDDREGEVDDDVGVLDQRVDSVAVEHVTAPVFGLLPAVPGEVEGPPRHADYPVDLRYPLRRGDEGPADLPGRPGDCDGQHAAILAKWRRRRRKPRALQSGAHVDDVDAAVGAKASRPRRKASKFRLNAFEDAPGDEPG